MPLVYKVPGTPEFIIRKPPSHFVFDIEADLISSAAVSVHKAWQTKLLPQWKSKRLDVGQLLQFDNLIDRMTLWDTLDQGRDYLVKFQGAEISRIFGEGMAGNLSQTPKPHFDALMSILDLLQSSRSAVINGPALNAFPGREFLVSQSLFLPVFADDDEILQVLVYSDYFTKGEIEKRASVNESRSKMP